MGQGGWAGLAWAAIPCSSPLQYSTRVASLIVPFYLIQSMFQTNGILTLHDSFLMQKQLQVV